MPPIQLPIIDISKATPEAGKAMVDAAIKYGFLYVDSASCGIPLNDVEAMFGMSREFFASPYEEKAQVKIGKNNRGWTGMHRETLDPDNQPRGDFKEAMNLGEFKDDKAQQPLPKSLSPREAEIARFTTLCQKTCEQILTLIALGLDIPPNWFSTRHDLSTGRSKSILRLLYYPSIESPSISGFDHDVDVRAGAHSDYGSITLLFQRDGQPGLEMLRGGEWVGVPVRPQQQQQQQQQHTERDGYPPILVNIGDLLNDWTCGLLKSTVHRVVFPKEEREGGGSGGGGKGSRDRYSMTYFCHPVNQTELVPVPSQMVERHRLDVEAGSKSKGEGEGEKEGGRVITAGQHLAKRLAATYGGLAEDYDM